MFKDGALEALLAEVIKQWNIAEERIKKAEQVRGNEVVASAIFELRYAGRKIVDALALARTANELSPGHQPYDTVHAYLADAVEDCVKAKHDAIDAMMTFVTSWFDRVEKSLGLSKIQQLFPDFLETAGMIADVQDKITASRGDRNTLRDSIYDAIDKPGGEYERILSLFERMRNSNERVASEVARERWAKIGMWGLTIAGVVLGAISLLK